MKVGAVLLAIVGALFTLVIGYAFWGGTFGQIGVRVPSYPWLVLLGFLLTVIGGLTVIWSPGVGGGVLLVALAALVLLDLKLVVWVLFQATDFDSQLAPVITNAAIGLLLPIAVLGLSAFLAFKRHRRRSAPG